MAKELKYFLIFIAIMAFFACIGCCASHWYEEDDSPMEEIAEELIEGQTGLELDFTPQSPE